MIEYLCWFHGDDDTHKRVVEAVSSSAAAEVYVRGKHATDALPHSDDCTWLVCVSDPLPGVDSWAAARWWRVRSTTIFAAQRESR